MQDKEPTDLAVLAVPAEDLFLPEPVMALLLFPGKEMSEGPEAQARFMAVAVALARRGETLRQLLALVVLVWPTRLRVHQLLMPVVVVVVLTARTDMRLRLVALVVVALEMLRAQPHPVRLILAAVAVAVGITQALLLLPVPAVPALSLFDTQSKGVM